jgi:hypothetical protein
MDGASRAVGERRGNHLELEPRRLSLGGAFCWAGLWFRASFCGVVNGANQPEEAPRGSRSSSQRYS